MFKKLLVISLLVSGLIFYINYLKVVDFKLKEDKIVEVKSGDTTLAILSKELGLPKDYLKIYLKLNPEITINLQAGKYKFSKGEDLRSIIKTINSGSIDNQKRLTILEGWSVFDIDEYLSKQNLIKPYEFVSESRNIDKYKKDYLFLQNALTLEGYLYPDTYFIDPNNFSIERFNRTMLDNFKKKPYSNLLYTISPDQINIIVTLASILEKEEKNTQEKPIIAGILKKRYKENWFIGADATACYAYELTSNECKMKLSQYIEEKNEYNTRTMVGLPKTPICNPSFESISAIINSRETPYYYYLHDKSGKVHYAETNEEHNINKRYLK